MVEAQMKFAHQILDETIGPEDAAQKPPSATNKAPMKTTIAGKKGESRSTVFLPHHHIRAAAIAFVSHYNTFCDRQPTP
jgi:hypothetical protein